MHKFYKIPCTSIQALNIPKLDYPTWCLNHYSVKKAIAFPNTCPTDIYLLNRVIHHLDNKGQSNTCTLHKFEYRGTPLGSKTLTPGKGRDSETAEHIFDQSAFNNRVL